MPCLAECYLRRGRVHRPPLGNETSKELTSGPEQFVVSCLRFPEAPAAQNPAEVVGQACTKPWALNYKKK